MVFLLKKSVCQKWTAFLLFNTLFLKTNEKNFISLKKQKV
jgi:hypothetical protein